jgi:isoquinoline 1-oxidoreductase beta subunit
MVSFSLPTLATSRPFEPITGDTPEINAWLTIDPDNSIIVRVSRAEMGQGVMTSLPMLIAEELEADWQQIKVEYADVNRQIRNLRPYGTMATYASNSIRLLREPLQQAGAEARERLIKAAAETWVVDPAECYADYGEIYHRPTRRSVTYGEVAPLAARINVAGVRIKTPREFNGLGLPVKRLDVPAKVDGSAVFGMDVRLPDMVYATVVHCPVIGGKLKSMRFNAIRSMPGVLAAVRMEGAVGVVADTFWHAKKAADALPLFWDIGASGKTFSDAFKQSFFEEFSNGGEVLQEKGDIVTLMDRAERTIESDYYVPYLAHAAMEPLNCTVHVQRTFICITAISGAVLVVAVMWTSSRKLY